RPGGRDGARTIVRGRAGCVRGRHGAIHAYDRKEVMNVAKGRILVVDDEIYIVHILDFSLGMEGYEVLTALDGEQALEKARAEHPDLIVLDIMMPKLDGYETCKMLKSDENTRNIPIILLSAKGRNVDQKVGFEVG